MLRTHPSRRQDEGFAGVVDMQEVARDLRIDIGRVRAMPGLEECRRHQARGVLERSVDRVEAQVDGGETKLLPGEVDEVGGGRLRNRVMAVAMERRGFGGAGRIVTILRRTAGMNIGVNARGPHRLDEARGEIDVRAVDEADIRLEGIGAVRDAVEDRSGPNVLQKRFRILLDEEVAGDHMVRGQTLEPPRGALRARADDVATMTEEQAQQIGADEAARAQDQDRSAQLFDRMAQGVVDTLGCEQGRVVRQWKLRSLPIAARTLVASSPHSRRWKACDP